MLLVIDGYEEDLWSTTSRSNGLCTSCILIREEHPCLEQGKADSDNGSDQSPLLGREKK